MKELNNTVRGTKDLLPCNVEIRDFVINKITETYQKFGFRKIETPSLENLAILCDGEGGENEKLIFKILKRGEKLDLNQPNISLENLCDLGLRFDLTVPLSRFVAGNFSKLSFPFKSIQIGRVWRAEKPQKGRLREFVQCDIDVIGDSSIVAEVELILAATEALLNIGFDNFTVHINDRRFLTALAFEAGFLDSETHDKIFIILDKFDKIGLKGISDELKSSGFNSEKVDNLINKIQELDKLSISLDNNLEQILTSINQELKCEFLTLLDTLNELSDGKFKIKFDPFLVRGMSYYTGPIFEIKLESFNSSIAGGGRYDKMIGKRLGKEIPACGFSIGFERIITILEESKFIPPTVNKSIVVIYEEGISLPALFKYTKALIKENYKVFIELRKKNLKKQLDIFKENNVNYFVFFKEKEAREINVIS